MLNIFNMKLYKDYNVCKKHMLLFCNPRSTINEQRKKKLITELKKKLREESKKKTITELEKKSIEEAIISSVFEEKFNEYLDNIYYSEGNLLLSPLKLENERLNKLINNHKPYCQPLNSISYDCLEKAINSLVEKYMETNCKYLDSIDCFSSQSSYKILSSNFIDNYKEYLPILIKKFCLHFLYFEYNENPSSLKKTGLYDTLFNNCKEPKKQLDAIFNRLMIVPFLQQHISNNCSLVVDNKKIFGTFSTCTLAPFFQARTNSNPYNYTFWNLTTSINDNRHTYTLDKYQSFLNVLNKTKFDNDSFIKSLQKEIFEFVTNDKFISFNIAHSPLKFSIGNIHSKKVLQKVSSICCAFYYSTSIIPISDYRLILSAMFHKIFFSYKNYERVDWDKWTEDIQNFLLWINDIVYNLLPSIINNIHWFVCQYYNLNSSNPQIEEMNSEIKEIWNNLYSNNRQSSYKNFVKQFSPVFITKNENNKKAFTYLHELIFSAVYFDHNEWFKKLRAPFQSHYAPFDFSFFGEYDNKVTPAQINISNISDKDTLVSEFLNSIQDENKVLLDPNHKPFFNMIQKRKVQELKIIFNNIILRKELEQLEQ